jgi:hypothetical protein
MARATTPHPIHGKIGNLIYRVRNGKQFVHEAPATYVFRQGTPAHGLNRQEFGAAAKIASDIYRNIKPRRDPEKLGPIFAPYPQNILTAKLKLGADTERKRTFKDYSYADEFCFRDTARSLMGLDLSHARPQQSPGRCAPAECVHMQPLGPQHNPTSIKVTGLDQAAAVIDAHGNARLEFRFQIRQTRVLELKYHKEENKWMPKEDDPSNSNTHHAHKVLAHSQPTDWIPVEIIPNQGFTLPIPKWAPDAKYATVVMIEWREIRAVGHRIKPLHDHGIVRIVSFHAPAEAWLSPHKTIAPTAAPSHTAHEAMPFTLPIDPEAFIKAAMRKLIT